MIICYKPVPRFDARQLRKAEAAFDRKVVARFDSKRFRRRLIVREAAELLAVLTASTALALVILLVADAAGF